MGIDPEFGDTYRRWNEGGGGELVWNGGRVCAGDEGEDVGSDGCVLVMRVGMRAGGGCCIVEGGDEGEGGDCKARLRSEVEEE